MSYSDYGSSSSTLRQQEGSDEDGLLLGPLSSSSEANLNLLSRRRQLPLRPPELPPLSVNVCHSPSPPFPSPVMNACVESAAHPALLLREEFKPRAKGLVFGKKYEYECVFCKGNKQPEVVYKSHPIRLNETIMCPDLRRHVCGICGATGDNAHTIKYCPFNKKGFYAGYRGESRPESGSSTSPNTPNSGSSNSSNNNFFKFPPASSSSGSGSTSVTLHDVGFGLNIGGRSYPNQDRFNNNNHGMMDFTLMNQYQQQGLAMAMNGNGNGNNGGVGAAPMGMGLGRSTSSMLNSAMMGVPSSAWPPYPVNQARPVGAEQNADLDLDQFLALLGLGPISGSEQSGQMQNQGQQQQQPGYNNNNNNANFMALQQQQQPPNLMGLGPKEAEELRMQWQNNPNRIRTYPPHPSQPRSPPQQQQHYYDGGFPEFYYPNSNSGGNRSPMAMTNTTLEQMDNQIRQALYAGTGAPPGMMMNNPFPSVPPNTPSTPSGQRSLYALYTNLLLFKALEQRSQSS